MSPTPSCSTLIRHLHPHHELSSSPATNKSDVIPLLMSQISPRRGHRMVSSAVVAPPLPPKTAATTAAAAVSDDDFESWDYSETERWGWVILILTWLVFVMGMGSCLEVWSWAWDVGETPYAPPELEDDPTLPITGYYPALIIMTAVMAWVWVVVAWVGMKYFRHANMVGDEL